MSEGLLRSEDFLGLHHHKLHLSLCDEHTKAMPLGFSAQCVCISTGWEVSSLYEVSSTISIWRELVNLILALQELDGCALL